MPDVFPHPQVRLYWGWQWLVCLKDILDETVSSSLKAQNHHRLLTLRASSYPVSCDYSLNSIVFLVLGTLPIFISASASLTSVKTKQKTHKEEYIWERGKKSNNDRDRIDITSSLLALNTVLNSTIPFRIVMCWNGEKICLPSVMLSYSGSYEMSLFNRRAATNFR